MAQDDKQSGSVGLSDAADESGAPKSFRPLSGPSLPIALNTDLGGGARIFSVSVDSRPIQARGTVAIKLNSQIGIYGQYLSAFDEWQVQQTGKDPVALPNPIPVQGGVIINFTESLGRLLGDGANFGISLFSTRLGGRRRILPLVFVYEAEATEDEKQNAARQSQTDKNQTDGQIKRNLKDQQANFARMMTESAGQVIAGSGGGFVSGFGGQSQTGKTSAEAQAKASAQGISSTAGGGSIKTSQQLDMDYDTEAEGGGIEQTIEGETEGRPETSTSEVSGTVQQGSGVISRQGTAEGNVQAFGGSTVEQAKAGTISTGATVGGPILGTSGTAVEANIKASAQGQAQDSIRAGIKLEKQASASAGTEFKGSGARAAGTGGTFSAGGAAGKGLNLGGGFTAGQGFQGQVGTMAAATPPVTQNQRGISGIAGQTQKTAEQSDAERKLAQEKKSLDKSSATLSTQSKPVSGPTPSLAGKELSGRDVPSAEPLKTQPQTPGYKPSAPAVKGTVEPPVKGQEPQARPALPGRAEYQKQMAAMKGRDRAMDAALGKPVLPKAQDEDQSPTNTVPNDRAGGATGKQDEEAPQKSADAPSEPLLSPSIQPQDGNLPQSDATAPPSMPPKGEGMPLAAGSPVGPELQNRADEAAGQKPDEKEKPEEDDKSAGESLPLPSRGPKQGQGQRAAVSVAEKEAAFAANQALDKALLTGVVWVWGAAIPTFGISVLLGAIVGDLVWLFKGVVLNRIQRESPLLKKFKDQNIEIELSGKVKINILAMNFAAIALALLLFTLIASVVWGICNSKFTYFGREKYGLEPYCKTIEQSFVGKGLNYISTGTGRFQGSYNTPGSLMGTQKWTEAINTAAQKHGIDACVLRAVVQAESGGRENAVGCHCAFNSRPQLCAPFEALAAPLYNLNWQACGHDIGLTQVAIYPQGSAENYKKWCDLSIPSRFIAGACYTSTDLLNPPTALDITARVFSDNINNARGDVAAAFGAYVGQSAYTQTFVGQRMALYNLCVQQR